MDQRISPGPRRILPTGGFLLLGFFIANALQAGDAPPAPAAAIERVPWGATLTGGGLEHDWQAGAELLAPIAFGNDTLLFLYPEFGTYDSGRQSYSIGLGVRRYLESLDAIIGVNAFYDHTETDYDNNINQFGIGAEWMSRIFDARFNYYLPEDDWYLTDSRRTRESSRHRSVKSSFGTPYAAGNSVLQPLITKTTTATRTTTRKFDRFEAGMEGIDTEIGIDAPLLSRVTDLKLFGGYYNYDDPFTGDIEGFKARAEWRIHEHVTIDIAYYEDEELFGGNVYGGVRVHFPLGTLSAPATYESHSLARELGAKQPAVAKTPVASRTPKKTIRHRLTENIIRTPRAITADSGYIEDVDARRTAVHRETKSRVAGTHTLASDVVFVNNGTPANGIQSGSASGNGSAENPADTIQRGVDVAAASGNSTVYVQGGGPSYAEDVDIIDVNVNLVGSGRGIPGNGGQALGGGQAKPELVGGIAARGGAALGISSFAIRQGRASSLAGATAGSRGVGAGIYTETVGEVTVANNMITNTSGDAVEITAADFAGDIRANVANNMITGAGGDGIELAGDMDVNVNSARISNNVITNTTEDAIRVATANSTAESIFDTMINGNVIDSPGQHGILLFANDEAFAKVTNNRITNQQDVNAESIHVEAWDFYGAVTDNEISNSAGWGMNVAVVDTFNGFIERNTVSQSGGKGILVVAGSDYNGQFVSNFSDLAADEAIEFRTVTGLFNGDFSDNTGNNSTIGIRTDVGLGADVGITTGNFASGNGTDFQLSPAGFGGP